MENILFLFLLTIVVVDCFYVFVNIRWLLSGVSDPIQLRKYVIDHNDVEPFVPKLSILETARRQDIIIV